MNGPTPVNSFFRFLAGFFLFISLSFGLTFTASHFARAKDQSQAAAAAFAEMIKQQK